MPTTLADGDANSNRGQLLFRRLLQNVLMARMIRRSGSVLKQIASPSWEQVPYRPASKLTHAAGPTSNCADLYACIFT